ncbi:MAG: amidohydrolase [Candidatus Tectimicrobiota bacterium]|nr:MAG: amidohydrolase [Candidatus Tectomicrobia bacterium]
MAAVAISADSHMDLIYLPADTFTSRVPAAWKARVPHLVETPEGKVWVSDGKKLARFGYYGPGLTAGRRGAILVAEGFASGEKTSPADPQLRQQDQDRDGVAAEVIYGILGVSRGLLGGQGISDPELLAVVYHAYNDFIASFNAQAPQRFCGLGCLPNHDVAAAVQEARHCAELGLKGVTFVAWTPGMPIWHPYWEPLWAVLEELGLVLSFHVFEGGGTIVEQKVDGQEHAAAKGAWLVVSPMQLDEVLTSVVFSGIPERHPQLKLVLGESGIGWIPYVLERMDYTYEDRLSDDLQLSLPPSAYFRRQIYATFQKDPLGVRLMAELAPDNVMWANDYPHRDGTWPYSQQVIAEQFAGIAPHIVRKMLWENVSALYGLGL